MSGKGKSPSYFLSRNVSLSTFQSGDIVGDRLTDAVELTRDILQDEECRSSFSFLESILNYANANDFLTVGQYRRLMEIQSEREDT